MSVKRCIHYWDNSSKDCPMPIFVGSSHGWLCKEHYRQLQIRIPSVSVSLSRAELQAADNRLVGSILASEQEAIASGKRIKMRYGSIAPVVTYYWEKQS